MNNDSNREKKKMSIYRLENGNLVIGSSFDNMHAFDLSSLEEVDLAVEMAEELLSVLLNSRSFLRSEEMNKLFDTTGLEEDTQ